jgi:hypothetical protein
MFMKTVVIIATLLSLTLAKTALAAPQDTTVGGLLKACEAELEADYEKIWDNAFCLGTMTTSLQYLFILERDSKSFYLPEDITMGQLNAIFVKWAKGNPEKWHKASHIGMIKAVIEAFPR